MHEQSNASSSSKIDELYEEVMKKYANCHPNFLSKKYDEFCKRSRQDVDLRCISSNFENLYMEAVKHMSKIPSSANHSRCRNVSFTCGKGSDLIFTKETIMPKQLLSPSFGTSKHSCDAISLDFLENKFIDNSPQERQSLPRELSLINNASIISSGNNFLASRAQSTPILSGKKNLRLHFTPGASCSKSVLNEANTPNNQKPTTSMQSKPSRERNVPQNNSAERSRLAIKEKLTIRRSPRIEAAKRKTYASFFESPNDNSKSPTSGSECRLKRVLSSYSKCSCCRNVDVSSCGSRRVPKGCQNLSFEGHDDDVVIAHQVSCGSGYGSMPKRRR